MIYASILKDLLKKETSPVKKMYLNELILNWKKVQTIIDSDYEDASFIQFIKGLNSYLYLLNNPKYSAKKDSKTSFDPAHEIFSPTYLEDLICLILKPSGLLSNPTLKLAYQTFNYNLHFKSMSFLDSILKHKLDFNTSEPVFCLVMDMNLQYRPASKKIFLKDNFSFPLMLFYISKKLNKQNITHIVELENQLKMSNPQAKVIIICETIEAKSVNAIEKHKEKLFILKKSLDTDDFKEIDLSVALALQKYISDTIKEKYLKNADFISQGCNFPIEFTEIEIENTNNIKENITEEA